MILEFNEDMHEYKLNGQFVPSATQIINDILPGYDAGVWYKARGRAMHAACHLLDENRLDWKTVHPEIESKVRAWGKFRKDWKRPILAREIRLGHPAYLFGGQIDVVFDGGEKYHVICDLKSTITPQVRIQLGFYSLLWKRSQMTNAKRPPECRGVAVELRADGDYRCLWIRADEMRRHEQDALSCLGVYNFRKLYNLKGTVAV